MQRWGVVTTAKESVERTLKFVDYHLGLGARVYLYLDDPWDACISKLVGRDNVDLTICDDAHWNALGGRPEKHQRRQGKNANHAYRRCEVEWLAHIDVDEFIYSPENIADVLASIPKATLTVGMEPFEEITLSCDGSLSYLYGCRIFRGALNSLSVLDRQSILGEYESVLPEGMLSHSNGKKFFRTGVPGLMLKIHGALLNGMRVGGRFSSSLLLLHSHAVDFQLWSKDLQRRVKRGAYSIKPELAMYLSSASESEIADFFQQTQTINEEKFKILEDSYCIILVEKTHFDK